MKVKFSESGHPCECVDKFGMSRWAFSNGSTLVVQS